MTKRELAIKNHNNGYNCCQAVACAFSEELGVEEPGLGVLTQRVSVPEVLFSSKLSVISCLISVPSVSNCFV